MTRKHNAEQQTLVDGVFYADTGCYLHPSCLNCPRAVCIHDEEAEKEARYDEICALLATGEHVVHVASRFHTHPKAIRGIWDRHATDQQRAARKRTLKPTRSCKCAMHVEQRAEQRSRRAAITAGERNARNQEIVQLRWKGHSVARIAVRFDLHYRSVEEILTAARRKGIALPESRMRGSNGTQL